jgi:hypothetical protein
MLLLQFLLAGLSPYFLLATLVVFLFLAARVPGKDSEVRPTAFFSSIVNRQIVYGYNHFAYVLLNFLLVLLGFGSLIALEVSSFPLALYFWATLALSLTFLTNLSMLVYGIFTNTTPF